MTHTIPLTRALQDAAPELFERLVELMEVADLSLDYRPEFRRAIANAYSTIHQLTGEQQ